MSGPNVPASVRARLRNLARDKGVDFSAILTRYTLERLLYRLSIGDHADEFLLKGALLFDMWFDIPARPTRDIDLLDFGDAVTPGPDRVTFPVTLAGFPAPELGAYPRYSVVSEKLDAIVTFGMANSRLKDYFDLWILATFTDFDGPTLTRAIDATFQRRLTPLPAGLPIGLTSTFADDAQKRQQWTAFARRNRLKAPPLTEVVHLLGLFLDPALAAAGAQDELVGTWREGAAHMNRQQTNPAGKRRPGVGRSAATVPRGGSARQSLRCNNYQQSPRSSDRARCGMILRLWPQS